MVETTVAREEFEFNLHGPCNECPFRKGAKLHTGILKDMSRFFDSIDSGTFAFSCHKTDPRSDGYIEKYDGKLQHCGGSLVFQRNIGMLRKNRALLADYIMGRLDYSLIRKSKKVFESKFEMLKHYLREYKQKHPNKILDAYNLDD